MAQWPGPENGAGSGIVESAVPRAGMSVLGRAARVALNAVLPPRCLGCGEPVADTGTLCAPCWSGLSFIAPPVCAACGYPFAFAEAAGALCGACARDRPVYNRARAALVYDAASRGLILALKHGDRTDSAPSLARWIGGAARALLDEADLVAPVPLHRWRLLARRYNQSALLAHALARATGLPCVADLLVRWRRTPSQGGLTARQRRDNVRGAFAVNRARTAALAGKRVVLVDDVLTTGATAESCARALIQGGAAAVEVATLARVVRPAA
jgi:ComF family protein